MTLRALFLDFGNTLVHEVPSRFELYAREARARGVDIDETAMRGFMSRAAGELPVWIGDHFRYSDGWFEAYIERIFHEGLGLAREELGPLRARLFEVFSDAATFALFPGARELLQSAREAGLALGLISNWSPRLPGILDGMGLTACFDTVLCSALERCEKPDPEIFERALARTGVAPAAALHAGDHPEKDVAAALAAGMQAVLIDHAGSMQGKDAPRLTSLRALRDHVLSMTQAPPLMTDLEALQTDIDRLRDSFASLRAGVGETFLGQEDVSELLLIGLLAGGHALLEGAPGLGKTTLVRGLAANLALDFARIQFTPDLMPADVLGTRMLQLDDDGGRHFAFEPGPIFTHVLLADEINRATPRTQSALLEAMQERQVTVFGETRKLEEPFMVVATENPIEMEGTYPLPEAQLDRFLFKITLEMPRQDELERILTATTGKQHETSTAGLTREDVNAMRELVRAVPVSSEVVRLVSALILATHPGGENAPERVRALVRYGSSPRGGQALLLASKVRALVAGRLHVTVDDVEALAPPALRHRVLLGYEGEASGVPIDELVLEALQGARKACNA